MVPDFLSHYYECARGPFRSLSDLTPDEAQRVQADLRQQALTFAAQRQPDYLQVRRALEERVRALFIAKGGRPSRMHPHSMLLGACDWVRSWYVNGCDLRVPLAQFAADEVSFTYGDIFPAMRFGDGKPYRGHVYTLQELPTLIGEFGLPQDWNPNGHRGLDRYIEAQVWSDKPVAEFLAD